MGSLLFEDYHVIDSLEAGEHKCTILFVVDRSVAAFQLSHRCIGVESDDEDISQLSRLAQVVDMTGMDDIKAAVGENDFPAATLFSLQDGLQTVEADNRLLTIDRKLFA